jgi:hypothetical protein
MTRATYVNASRLHRQACRRNGNRPYYEYTEYEYQLSDLQAAIILTQTPDRSGACVIPGPASLPG